MALPLPEDPYETTTEAGDHVALTMHSIDEYHQINLARDSAAGAICSFIGTTRDNFQGVQWSYYFQSYACPESE